MLNTLVITEIQIKTTMRDHFTLVRMRIKDNNKKVLVRMWRNLDPCAWLVGL